MIFLLLLLAQAPSFGPPPEPPPPPPMGPCQINPAQSCTIVNMLIEGPLPRSFTTEDLGRPLTELDESVVCYGRLSRGTFRYYVDGTAPSSMVGILVPSPVPLEGDMPNDPSGTLQEGNVIQLFNREQLLNFKAIWSNWAGADLTWECQL